MQRGMLLLWGVMLLWCIPGCGWGDEEEDAASEIDPISIIEQVETNSNSETQTQGRLELKLSVGDRFPLIKTVEQTITQKSPQGESTSHSKLELLLSISVEEVSDGLTRMSVLYHRVRYRQDVAGEKIEYDSSVADARVPIQVVAYRGLVNNGFDFWIGPDNQLVKLVEFDAFLKRCVQTVDPSIRQRVMTRLIEQTGDDGIANFVDDSIGLLPYSSGQEKPSAIVTVGHQWTRKRQILRPIPIYLTNDYTLKELTEKMARVDVVGEIVPSSTYGPLDEKKKSAHIKVRGGRTTGRCTIDRDTGLPLNSRVERNLDMTVFLGNGVSFDQHKTVVTTIRAFPEQGITHASFSTEARKTSAGSARVFDSSVTDGRRSR